MNLLNLVMDKKFMSFINKWNYNTVIISKQMWYKINKKKQLQNMLLYCSKINQQTN